MGAWRYLRAQFGETLFKRFPFQGVFRPASASPATGSMNSHKLEQKELLAEAFAEANNIAKSDGTISKPNKDMQYAD